MTKYNILLNIIDEIRNEAPKNYKKYYPAENELEKLDNARSRAFIHLYLKVHYGISEFEEREKYITDGSYDGGIDAYYIDYNLKRIIFIQSKFRTNQNNFESKEISLDEVLKMDVERIVKGENCSEDGIEYNSKIQNMINCINSIRDIGRYDYDVIILANLHRYKSSIIKRITGGFEANVFNYEKCYKELMFPVVTGSFYDANEIIINLSLTNKESNEGKISYSVQTEFSDCKIMVVFVPLMEIAKIIYKYKNAILKYNPRCYLSLTNNDVNPKIAKTVKQKSTNEFALFNNGITILSDKTEFNSRIAVKDTAQLIINNPQIINGGQTAYTLSSIYEECLKDEDYTVLDNKEVLVKVITFFECEECQEKKMQLIEELSKATNEQSTVYEADRHSNDKVQINYQNKIFDDFGYFYNRKRGEFLGGLRKKYITNDKIVDRAVFIRIAISILGNPATARRNGDEVLFKNEYASVFVDDLSYRRYMFGFFCHQYLSTLEKKFNKTINNRFGSNTYGNAIRYGKYAVVNVVNKYYSEDYDLSEYFNIAKIITDEILLQWVHFEDHISKLKHNNSYFETVFENNQIKNYYNYDGYYKGRTINKDLNKYNFNFTSTEQLVAVAKQT